MKKVLDSVKNVFDETTGLLGEGYQSATGLLKETLSNFYDVKNLTSEKLADMANDLIALSPIIEKLQKMEINCKIHPYIYIATNDSMSGFYAFTCSQM